MYVQQLRTLSFYSYAFRIFIQWTKQLQMDTKSSAAAWVSRRPTSNSYRQHSILNSLEFWIRDHLLSLSLKPPFLIIEITFSSQHSTHTASSNHPHWGPPLATGHSKRTKLRSRESDRPHHPLKGVLIEFYILVGISVAKTASNYFSIVLQTISEKQYVLQWPWSPWQLCCLALNSHQ
jgi:hypothetical protein